MNYNAIQKALSRKEILFIALFVIFLSTFFTYRTFADAGHDHGGSATEGGVGEFPIVTVSKVEFAKDKQEDVIVSGVVLSKKQSIIHPAQDGVLDSLFVDIGDRVVKGQVLGILKPSVEQLQLQAEGVREKAQLDSIDEKINLLQNGVVVGDGTRQSILQQLLDKIDTDISIASKSIEAKKVSLDSSKKVINEKIASLEFKRRSSEESVKNSALDVIEASGKALYKNSNLALVVVRDFNSDYRLELYALGNDDFVNAKNNFREVYQKAIAQDNLSGEVIEDVALVGKQIRTLLTKYGDDHSDTVDFGKIRKDLDESIDHLYEIQKDFVGISVEIQELEAELSGKEIDYTQDLVEIEGEISKFLKDKQLANISFVHDLASLEQEKEIQNQNLNALYISAGAGNIIRAPFSGVITKRMSSVGESVSFEKGLLEIIDDSELFVRFTVFEEDLPFVQPDTIVKVSPSSLPSSIIEMPIVRQSSVINPQTGGLIVEAVLSEKNTMLLANMTVTVSVPVRPDESALAIPRDALKLGVGNKVWIVNSAVKAEQRDVKVLYVKNDTAFVTGGIDEKTWVITSSPETLREGLDIDTEL